MLFTPSDGDLWLQFLQALQRGAGLIELVGLRKTSDEDAMTGSHPITLLYCLSGETDGLGVSAREVIRDR